MVIGVPLYLPFLTLPTASFGTSGALNSKQVGTFVFLTRAKFSLAFLLPELDEVAMARLAYLKLLLPS